MKTDVIIFTNTPTAVKVGNFNTREIKEKFMKTTNDGLRDDSANRFLLSIFIKNFK